MFCLLFFRNNIPFSVSLSEKKKRLFSQSVQVLNYRKASLGLRYKKTLYQ